MLPLLPDHFWLLLLESQRRCWVAAMTNLVEADVPFKSELRSPRAQALQTGTGQCFNEAGVSGLCASVPHLRAGAESELCPPASWAGWSRELYQCARSLGARSYLLPAQSCGGTRCASSLLCCAQVAVGLLGLLSVST